MSTWIHGSDPEQLDTEWDVTWDEDDERVTVDLYGDQLSSDGAMLFAADVLEVAGYDAEIRWGNEVVKLV